MVKNPPAKAGDISAVGLIPGLGRSTGGGNGNPLQFSCLENPLGRGAWRPMVHTVPKSQIQLKWLSMHTTLDGKLMEHERSTISYWLSSWPFAGLSSLGGEPCLLKSDCCWKEEAGVDTLSTSLSCHSAELILPLLQPDSSDHPSYIWKKYIWENEDVLLFSVVITELFL